MYLWSLIVLTDRNIAISIVGVLGVLSGMFLEVLSENRQGKLMT